jgi:GTP-binding protein
MEHAITSERTHSRGAGIKPLVAIVGRPNVGKSSLFNRLVGRREAVVSEAPGTTRDRIIGDVEWDGRLFTLVDTGGLEGETGDPLKEKVRAQVEMAIEDADLVLFVVDAEEGLNPMDEEIAQWLRRLEKPLITIANKADNEQREATAAEFHQLGLGEPLLMSAYHNLGTQDLMEQVLALLPEWKGRAKETKGVPKLAIIGRTNVGKSMLMNAILGEERAIVSDVAGTTRDSLDTRFVYKDKAMVLIDTAGMRRRGQIRPGIEKYSVLRSVKAVERCDIALVVLDAMEIATEQDTHIFGMAMDSFKGIIVVVNKWDLAPQETGTEQEVAIQLIRRRFHFMPYAPIVFTSALEKQGIQDILDLALEIYEERGREVPQNQLRRLMNDAWVSRPPSQVRGRRLELYQVRQVDVHPPTFVFNVNEPTIHFSYRRYLENKIRQTFGFRHTHLRLVFKRSSE